MNRPTLSLKRETLIELTATDLVRVAGAAGDPSRISCPLTHCLDRNLSDDLACHTRAHGGCWTTDAC